MRVVPHRPRVFRKGWAEELVHDAVDKYWKYDIRDPKYMWRAAEFYGFKTKWDEWYEANKDSATEMQCYMRLLHMKARNANKGRGMGALDASPIEGMHRIHSQTMARGQTLVDWDDGHYRSANKLRYDHFHLSGCMDPVDGDNESSLPTIENAIRHHVYNSESKQITVTIHYMNVPCEEVPSKTLLRACRERSREESKTKGGSAKPQSFSLAYERVSSIFRHKSEADVMSRVPICTTHAFMNGTTLELNKKKMKKKFIECNENIPKALGVPTILTTDISLSFYADPLDTTKYKAYVRQFRASVTYRGHSHECEPPWIYSSYDLAVSPQGFLTPEQTNLTILLPICLACVFNNGCPDEKPPQDSPYFLECCKLLVWSVGIVANEDRNRIRTHSIIQHYTRLSNGTCYLSGNDDLGGVIMMAELLSTIFQRKRTAEEPFTIAPGFDNELKGESLTYASIRSQMDQVLSDCKEVFGKGHLDHSHESQNDRLRNLGQFVICGSLSQSPRFIANNRVQLLSVWL